MKKRQRRKREILPIPLPGVDLGIQNRIVTDPLGSYTGRPVDEFQEPVQDVDDL